MLTADYLEQLPESVVNLWRKFETEVIVDVSKRIAAMDEINSDSAYQLWRLEQLQLVRTDVVQRLARLTGKNREAILKLMKEAIEKSYGYDSAIYAFMGIATGELNENPALVQLINAGYRQTLGTMQNFTRTTAATVTGEFEARLDRAWLQVTTGAFDYQTAIQTAIDDLAATMPFITYPTGHKDTLEVATRRAVLTGVNQTAAKCSEMQAEQLGCEFYETSAHSGARTAELNGPANHEWWQGRVFHVGGAVTKDGISYPDFVSSTGYGTGAGLCGWNCRHSFHPFFPGYSTPAYTPEMLAEYKRQKIAWNGQMYTEYEASQIQRAMERKIRKAKRVYLAEKAAGLDTTASEAKLAAAIKQVEVFCKATNMKRQKDREYVG